MFPFSFKEYASFYEKHDINSLLTSYLKFGGMPGTLIFDNNEIQIKQYLQMIFNDIVINDILNRNSVKDTIEFKNIVKYIGESIGKNISIRNIANYLKSNNTSATSVPTVSNYISWLCESLMIYQCNFSNIQGKELLKNLAKYYIVDLGIRNALLGTYGSNRGNALENIVYIELLRRGYDVKVGRIKKQQNVNKKKL
jgi:predicted AAA+ superfamily ATPase